MTLSRMDMKYLSAYAIVGLGIFTGLFALPPLKFGYYYQTDSAHVIFVIAGGLSALWLGFDRARGNPWFASPLVWGHFLWAGITAISSIFHTVPGMSWIGSPKMAEGVIPFISQGFFVALLLRLLQAKGGYKPLIACALTSGGIFSALIIIGSNTSPFLEYRVWDWAPYHFNDCIAFVALSFFVIAYYLFHQKLSLPWVICLIGMGLFLGYYSENKALYYSPFFAAMGCGGVWLWEKIGWSRFWGVSLGIAGAAIALNCTLMMADIFTSDTTLISRGYLLKTAFCHLWSGISWGDFVELLFGRGWGTYPDFIARNLFLLDIQIYNDVDWKPSWDALTRDFFHSHSSFIEYFVSLGVLGWLGSFYILMKYCQSIPKRHFWATSFYLFNLTIICGFWFQIMAVMPFTLLALALLTPATNTSPYVWRPSKFPLIAIGGLLCLAGAGYGVLTHLMRRNTLDGEEENLARAAEAVIQDPYFRLDSILGGKRIVTFVRHLTGRQMDDFTKDIHYSPQEVITTHLRLAQYLDNVLPSHGNLFARVISLNIHTEVAFNPKLQPFISTPNFLTSWEEALHQSLYYLPYRTDLAIAPLNYLILHHYNTKVGRVTQQILEKSSNDPVGLWFQGMLEMNDRATFWSGIAKAQQAIQGGITRFMPLKRAEVEKIMSIKPR